MAFKESLFEKRKLFSVNSSTKEYKYASNLDFTTYGLHELSDMYNFNDEVIIVNENIYQINNNITTKINEKPLVDYINPVRYKIQNNHLYYLEDTIISGISFSNRLYSYNGETNKEIFNFFNTSNYLYFDPLVDFIINGDYLYLSCYDPGLVRYNLIDKSINLIANHLTYIDMEFNYLFKYNNQVFYRESNNIYRILNNENPELLDLEISGISCYMFTLKNRLFLFSNKKIYEIIDSNILQVYEFADFGNQNIYMEDIIIDKNEENILFSFSNNMFYHFDGNSMDEIHNDTYLSSFTEIKNGFILLNSQNHLFYDCNSKLLGSIDGLEDQERIIDLVLSGEDTPLITTLNYRTTKIYKAKNNYQTLIPYDSFYNGLPYISFLPAGDNGILYAANLIYFMDSDKEFHKLENITIDYPPENIVEKDSFIYFFGIDKFLGRQVYRINKDFRINTTETSIEKLIIYPNPTDDIINISSENFRDGKFYIYNTKGILIQTGIIKNSIDISKLAVGPYFIIIEKNKEIATGTFIKINRQH